MIQSDLLALIISTAPLVVAIIGGFAWTVTRQDRLHRENRDFYDGRFDDLTRRLARLEALAMRGDRWREEHRT